MEEKKYNKDGFLLVSELYQCPYFEKDPSAWWVTQEDCFYCKHSDFRKKEYIEQVERAGLKGVLYSVCHNEKTNNRKCNEKR